MEYSQPFLLIWLRAERHPGEELGVCDDLGLEIYVNRTQQINSFDRDRGQHAGCSRNSWNQQLLKGLKLKNDTKGSTITVSGFFLLFNASEDGAFSPSWDGRL